MLRPIRTIFFLVLERVKEKKFNSLFGPSCLYLLIYYGAASGVSPLIPTPYSPTLLLAPRSVFRCAASVPIAIPKTHHLRGDETFVTPLSCWQTRSQSLPRPPMARLRSRGEKDAGWHTLHAASCTFTVDFARVDFGSRLARRVEHDEC